MTTETETTETATPTTEPLVTTIRQMLVDAEGAGVTVRDLEPILHDAPKTSIAATLSQLRADRERTGVIRIGPGEYAYRPDNMDEDTGDAGPPAQSRGNKGKIATILKEAGRPITVAEIGDQMAERFGVELERKQVSSSLVALVRDEPTMNRVGLGVYVYDPTAKGEPALNPFLTDSIPDTALEDGTGLKVVARAQDGSRIAIDENGTAWRITIKIESRLL
jgi:hypothetical protein